jgi:hypothetical protein
LKWADYPPELITIFVASEEEYEKYLRYVPSDYYGTLVLGVVGLKEQRNFITNYYHEGQILCCMDDDVDKILCRSMGTFQALLEKARIDLVTEDSGLWGILPKDDTRSFQDKTTTHLAHILGSFYVCRNDKSILCTITEKEDYERSILYFLKYKRILRFKGAGVRTQYAKTLGGLQQGGRVARMELGADYLSKKYPDLCKRVDKNGLPDLVLNWRAKLLSSTE